MKIEMKSHNGRQWRRRKYVRGAKLKGMREVVEAIDRGQWFFINNRPYHPGFVNSMTLATVVGFLRRGSVYTAERTVSS